MHLYFLITIICIYLFFDLVQKYPPSLLFFIWLTSTHSNPQVFVDHITAIAVSILCSQRNFHISFECHSHNFTFKYVIYLSWLVKAWGSDFLFVCEYQNKLLNRPFFLHWVAFISCQKSGGCSFMALFLGSPFCFIDQCVSLSTNTTHSVPLELWVLKWTRGIPLTFCSFTDSFMYFSFKNSWVSVFFLW